MPYNSERTPSQPDTQWDVYSDPRLESVRRAVKVYQARLDMLQFQRRGERKVVKRNHFRGKLRD